MKGLKLFEIFWTNSGDTQPKHQSVYIVAQNAGLACAELQRQYPWLVEFRVDIRSSEERRLFIAGSDT